MKRYRLDHAAHADVFSIHAYIARDNVEAADRFVEKLNHKFHLLAGEPLLGQQRDDLLPKLRSFCVGNYVIYYRPNENGIEVARVIHAARDMQILF